MVNNRVISTKNTDNFWRNTNEKGRGKGKSLTPGDRTWQKRKRKNKRKQRSNKVLLCRLSNKEWRKFMAKSKNNFLGFINGIKRGRGTRFLLKLLKQKRILQEFPKKNFLSVLSNKNI